MVKDDRADLRAYAAPSVTDHGHLRDLTAATHLLLGAADDASARDLSFSGTSSNTVLPSVTGPAAESVSAPLGGGGDVVSPGGGEVAGTEESGGSERGGSPTGSGGSAPGSGSSPGGGAGGTTTGSGSGSEAEGALPFTGFAAAAAGAAGTGLMAAGALMRRVLRRR